nr:AEC family transporter [Alkalicoccus halolimnae]
MTLGYVMQIKFQMDLQTLAKLNIYFLVPGFIFVQLYETEIAASLFGYVLLFFFLYCLLLYFLGEGLGRALGLKKEKKTTFTNSLMFFNSGNYGVPVNDLVFRGDPFAMSIQVIILTFQNIFLFSYGIFSLQAANIGRWNAAVGYFKMPVLYAMLLGVVLNYWNVGIPEFIWVPANYVGDAMIAMALVTLGAQVAQFKITTYLASIYWSIGSRLIIGPAVALLIIWLLPVEGVMAQAMFIASAMPTSVNSAVIAQEYKIHPEYASQVVLFSTLFSALTVSVVIYLSRIFFGG